MTDSRDDAASNKSVICETVDDVKRKLNDGVYVLANMLKKRKSGAWGKFDAVVHATDGKHTKFVHCREKGCILVYSTSSMRRHACSVEQKEATELSHHYVPANKKRRICDSVALMCCQDLRPFSMVQGSGFKKVAQTLISLGAEMGSEVDVEALLPHPTTVKNRVISIADDIRKVLVPRVTAAIINKRASFQADMWMEDARKITYTTVTVSTISETWHMENRVLFTAPFPDEEKTAVNVLSELVRRFESLQISEDLMKSAPFVTDQGPNIVAALKDFTRLPCACHCLNTLLKHTFKSEFLGSTPELTRVEKTINSCKALVAYCKRVGLSKRLTKSVKQEVEVRWNTLLDMLVSVRDTLIEIKELLPQKELCRLRNIDEKTLNELVMFLEPFKEATNDLERDNSPTLHLVLLWRCKLLEEHLSPSELDSDAIATLKSRCRSYMDGRNDKMKLHLYHKIATFLCPPYRDLLMLNTEDRHNVFKETGALCASISGTSSSHEVTAGPSKPLHPLKFQRYARSLDHADKHREISLYLSIMATEKDAEAETDILGWWKQHEKTLPSLARVAQSILCIPASSGSSERNFSAAGLVVTERRSRLDPNVVDDILLVHSNNDLLNTCDVD